MKIINEQTGAMQLTNFLTVLRVHHYSKNLLILAPLFFAGDLVDLNLLITCLLALLTFCPASSAVYIINDCFDRDLDRQHPTKMTRPIAAGNISINKALLLAVSMILVSLTGMYLINRYAMFSLLAYLLINLSYSAYIKHLAYLELFVPASGFLIRLLIGAQVTGLPLSTWILFMTLLLSLFLTLAKRRDDVLIYQRLQLIPRKAIKSYSLPMLDRSIKWLSIVIIASYLAYSFHGITADKFSGYFPLTTFFVAMGILRYLHITLIEEKSGAPTELIFQDRMMQASVVLWVCACAWIFYA